MLNDLSFGQKQLAELMQELSERCYSAGWMENLEYILWDTVINGERKFGQAIILIHDINKLKALSEACDCWIYYDEITEETGIDLLAWKEKYKITVSINPSIIGR